MIKTKRDFSWTFDENGENYTIKNAPFLISEDFGEMVDAEISLKMEMIAKLMYMGKVSNVVDFDDITDMDLDESWNLKECSDWTNKNQFV